MSRSPDPRDVGTPPQDAGFSLVEVIVAIGVLMIVMVALLPQLVLGIQATGTARLATQAKGVAQGELEKMRNLPYHISPEAGDFRDVLDSYYRNLTAPAVTASCMTSGEYNLPQTSWTGFVPAGNARCDYEPPNGVAFYRKVSQVSTATAGADFTVVATTRFLSEATPPQPVAAPAGYNSQGPNISDARPAASQIGVNATVLYRDRRAVRAVSTYTQIADRPVTTVRVRAEANVTAVEAGSVTTVNGPVSLSAGLLNLAGSLTYASTVNANLAGTSAGLATGAQEAGASRSVAVPPSSSAEVVNKGAGSLTSSGCDIACWGSTRLDVAPMSAAAGLPQAGTQAAPMQALVTDTASSGVSFGNSSPSQYRPELKLTPPLLRLHPDAVAAPSGISTGCVSGGSGTSSYVVAGGYLRTTAITDPVAPSVVESCAVARASLISLFPTDFAPKGVVLVELTRAMTRCTVSGAAHIPSVAHDYSAVVKYWNGSAYQTLPTISPSMSTDPLDAVDLSTTSVGGGRMLGDYIASWSSLLNSEIPATAMNGVAQVKLPGVITIASQPTRLGVAPALDATSVVSVAIGALGCLAEDAR